MANVEFYFQPTSFYSQKARLALEEKGISYKGTPVWLTDGDQNQAWYLKINPKGEVPTLKVGDQYFNESEKIMDIVDKMPSKIESKLVPDPNTSEGKLVTQWRQRIDELPVPIITFGVVVFRDFAHEKTNVSMFPTVQGVRDRFENNLKLNTENLTKHPELKESYERKIALTKQRLVDFFDREKVAGVLDGTDVIMSEVEQQLLKMSISCDLKGVDYFLCGDSFTAADINLCVLLGRFRMLGLLPRFADPQKYPSLAKYWERIQKRPSVNKVVMNNVDETKRLMIGRKIRRYTGVAAALGVLGVSVWLAYRHFKK